MNLFINLQGMCLNSLLVDDGFLVLICIGLSSMLMFLIENSCSFLFFGSGWAWLVSDSNNNLVITTTANQLNPLATGAGIPIVGSDLWEHAYYLQYLYNKDNYFVNFWNVVDWVQVGYFYDTYVSKGNPIPL